MVDASVPLPFPAPLPPPVRWRSLVVSVRGFSHERSGQENQDAGATRGSGEEAGPIFLALAVNVALEQLEKGVASPPEKSSFREKRARLRRDWPRAVVEAWHGAVRADLLARPFTFFEFAPFPEPQPVIHPEDKMLPYPASLCYGATLLAVAVVEDLILYAQLGDGDILTVSGDGRVRRPLPARHARLASTTPSLCSQQAELGVRVAVRPRHEKSPELILLSTDGYANSFADEAAFRQVGLDLWRYLKTKGLASIRDNLTPWLHSASVQGTGDDVTLGLIIREDILAPDPVSTAPEESQNNSETTA